jgi:tRNA1Val (adenine37-N6)-methyltransferase
MSVFRFKQFSVSQADAAMKVGTDSVLLGALVQQPGAISVLDIGTGTGLLALMMAQRFPGADIDAVEIDIPAYEEAELNIKKSRWSHRIHARRSSFLDYMNTCSRSYDLIISNPPYYRADHSFGIGDEQRSRARHDHELPFEALLEGSRKLVSDAGSCWFILPVQEAGELKRLSSAAGLFLFHEVSIRPKISKEVNRLVMGFCCTGQPLVSRELTIYEENGVYTEAYYGLTKDFYLWKERQ